MRIVIFGGTGQIGSVVTEYLVKALPGVEIISCSRKGGSKPYQKAFNVFKDNWSELGQVNVLVNCLGIIEEKGENTFQKAHIDICQMMVSKSAQLGNPKIIHVSALGADKNSKARYSSSKAEGESILRTYDNYMIFQPSFVCTPGTAIVEKIKMLGRMAKWQLGFLPIPAHFLVSKFQPVMGEDIAEASVQTIKKDLKGQTVPCTGPELFTMEDWIKMVGKGKIKLIRIPKALIDLPFRMIIKVFPQIMNKDQYIMLGNDNAADQAPFEKILGKEVSSTQAFWENELTA